MAADQPRQPKLFRSLSARLLALTIVFVMLGELLIFAPSVARFRSVYLEERIAEARLASIALETTPPSQVTRTLQQSILDFSNTYNIVLRLPRRSVLALGDRPPPPVDVTYDLRELNLVQSIADAFDALVQGDNRVLRVIGSAPNDSNTVVEVMLDERPLRMAMYAFSQRILGLSIILSLITAGLVFVALHLLIVRPMGRITDSMTRFRARPEDEATTIAPSARSDEIGVAQRELAVMQNDLRAALQQKDRLAALGAAVAKINHDLRNSLSTAVLVSDSLAESEDPEVKRIVPRLFDAIDRAVHLCSRTLNYARGPGSDLAKSEFQLHQLVADVGTGLEHSDLGRNGIEWRNQIEPDFQIEADPEQLHRVIANLGRNAFQAGADIVTLSAGRATGRICVDIIDDGPGLPEAARSNLFEPFSGSTREGGTGLGLVIARDVMRAHGGDVSLLATSEEGTTFRLMLPTHFPSAEEAATKMAEEAATKMAEEAATKMAAEEDSAKE